ncbi:translation initiation factor IF-2-like [Oxyura jamaicensis]|uniref:translation initiation factor IF-2-like n=1 Tax=Oxyura jamaicensis TaxID=8884 RepID=UPI0015A5E85F|nr:translation initiation factor IF-2-like [Oxyura jamaicensis]
MTPPPPSPCPAPREGHGGERGRAGTEGGREGGRQAGGRLPARGVEAPPRGRGESQRTNRRARRDSPPPALPPGGSRPRADTNYPPAAPGGAGSGTTTADKPARPAAPPLSSPPLPTRLAAGLAARPFPSLLPSLRAHPGRPAAALQPSRPGGKEGRREGGREVLALGRCCCRRRRVGFAGGGWERGAGRGEAGRPAWGRGVGPPPPRLGGSPAAGRLRPRAGRGASRSAPPGPRPARGHRPEAAPARPSPGLRWAGGSSRPGTVLAAGGCGFARTVRETGAACLCARLWTEGFHLERCLLQ